MARTYRTAGHGCRPACRVPVGVVRPAARAGQADM